MRTETINFFAELNAIELELLTAEVKETIATGVNSNNHKTAFTAANLWNVHNMKKVRTPRRGFMF